MKAAVLTVSDRVSRGEAEDGSGPAVAADLRAIGFDVTGVTVVPDGVESVSEALRRLCAEASLVVTTGGTGLGPRDLTPEATASVIERNDPGLAEAMRAATFGSNPHGMLSRGVCGTVGRTLVVNLPGSVLGATESLAVIAAALPHAVELLVATPSDHNAR